MNRILVAHGSRKAAGVAMIRHLADRVGEQLGGAVQVAFVDVLGPTPTDLLRGAAHSGEPALVVPAFLSRGYHVRTDLPVHLLASGHPAVTLTPALGPSRGLVRVVADQLGEFGWRPGDLVILAAAGSSDPVARTDLNNTAAMLSTAIGSRVELAFAATGSPSVAQAVVRARLRSDHRVLVASYLLAEGLFQDRLRASGADVVTDPLGQSDALPQLIARQFDRALLAAAA